MGFLDRLFGRKGGTATAPAKEEEMIADVPCPHGSLAAHWDEPEAMGKRDAVSYYICESCGERFDRDLREGQRLWERLEPGGELPAGECPDCAAQCYLAEEGSR